MNICQCFRYWVGAHGCQSSAITISDNLMQSTKQDVDRIRNTIRFIISNLPTDKNFQLKYEELKPVDQFMLHELKNFMNTVSNLYEEFAYNRICLATQNFVANELSAFYFTLVKDRLYCDAEDSSRRKSALTTLLHLGRSLTKLLSPIMPVLAQEIGQHCPVLEIDLSQPLDIASSDGKFLKFLKSNTVWKHFLPLSK